jgi:hypothetical protein
MNHESVTDEAWLDQQIESRKLKAKLKTASIETAWEGKASVVVEDVNKAKAKGVGFVYSRRSSVGSVFARLLDGTGLYSNRSKLQSGVVGNTTSLNGDNGNGGTNAVFCRMGNTNADGTHWGNVPGHGPLLVFHPRCLRRTDWYAHNSDSFGSTNSGSANREKAYGHTSGNNEINFEDGISFQNLAGVACDNESQRTQLIAWLKEEGIEEYNGIPIEEFIIVRSGNSRSYVTENLKGLQEGALE